MSYDIPGVGKSATKRVVLGRPLLRGIYQGFSTASASITVALPPAADNDGALMIIAKTTSDSNTVTIDPYGSETISGQSTVVLYSQYEVAKIWCDGSNWILI